MLTIRTAALSDAEGMLAIYAPYITGTAVSFEYEVPSLEEFRSRITSVQERYPWIVAERDGELVGYAYLSAFHPRKAYEHCAETSIYLRQDCRREGIGSALYHKLEEYARAMGIRNLNACIGVPVKEADEYLGWDSVRFHEKSGYTMVGTFTRCGYKFDRWYNMCWMEKLLAGEDEPKQPVVWFQQGSRE